jgi:hypothetical protein
LQIVRTLVETELVGDITVQRGDGPDVRPGTVVEVTFGLSPDVNRDLDGKKTSGPGSDPVSDHERVGHG